jgi:hypothetical protein
MHQSLRTIKELQSGGELAAEQNMFPRKVTPMDVYEYPDSEEESSESEEKPLTRHQALEQLKELRRRKQLKAADTEVHGIVPPMDTDESSSDSNYTSSSDSGQGADTTMEEDVERRKKKKKTTGGASMELEPLHGDENQEQEEDEDIVSIYRSFRKRRRTSNIIRF